jgi:hypothetical protein
MASKTLTDKAGIFAVWFKFVTHKTGKAPTTGKGKPLMGRA